MLMFLHTIYELPATIVVDPVTGECLLAGRGALLPHPRVLLVSTLSWLRCFGGCCRPSLGVLCGVACLHAKWYA